MIGTTTEIGQYLVSVVVSETPKTQRYLILNKNNQSRLGFVKWHPSWRQYCFFPEQDCVFSSGCMKDIIEFIKKIEDERKIQKGLQVNE